MECSASSRCRSRHPHQQLGLCSEKHKSAGIGIRGAETLNVPQSAGVEARQGPAVHGVLSNVPRRWSCGQPKPRVAAMEVVIEGLMEELTPTERAVQRRDGREDLRTSPGGIGTSDRHTQ